jgi:hypothetical protein
MELTIKELAPYLPYGLQGFASFYEGNIFIVELIGRGWVKGYTKYGNEVPIGCLINDFKPLLRPLSDLTKPITHNGETFVPLLKLGEILGFKNLEKFEIDDEVQYGWVDRYMDDSQGYAFGYFKDGEFGVWYDEVDNDHPMSLHCNYASIQLLLELHFDIFNLIENNLAIDINTIQQC